MKDDSFNIIFIIFMIIIVTSTLYSISNRFITDEDETIINNDTIYNTIVLDSIEYNIIVRDSIIYNLKQEMTNEIKESYSLTDSACIKLYEQLLKE